MLVSVFVWVYFIHTCGYVCVCWHSTVDIPLTVLSITRSPVTLAPHWCAVVRDVVLRGPGWMPVSDEVACENVITIYMDVYA